MRTGAADRRNHQIPHPYSRHVGPNLDYLPQGLMSDHQVRGTRGRCAVLKRANLFVGPADAHLEHPKFDVRRAGQRRSFVVNKLDLAFPRKYSNGFQRLPLRGSSTWVKYDTDPESRRTWVPWEV